MPRSAQRLSLIHISPFYNAKKANPKLRHMCLTGTNADTLVRCVGKVNYPAMRKFSEILRERIRTARNVRMVSQDGDEITFINVPDRPVSCKLGDASVPGTDVYKRQVAG